MNAQGKPARVDSPWIDRKISVTRSVRAHSDTWIRPCSMFIPQENGNSPAVSGRISTTVLALGASERRMPKSGKTISSRAGARIPAVEDQPERLAAARTDDVGRVTALDDDGDLASLGRRDGRLPFPEEEDEEREEQPAAHRNRGDPVRRPDDVQAHSSRLRLSLRLLATTDTELAAIAAEAIIGERIQPVSG